MNHGITARSEYLPKHEAFLIHVDLSDYLIDYYIHRKDNAPETSAEHDSNLKDLIACFAIHLMARATLETHAWTVHLVAEHPYSLFVTGQAGDADEKGVERGFLVGHILSDNIRHTDVNAIHGQCTHRGKTFRSLVRCDTSEIPLMVEQFYKQSEQRPLRIAISKTSDTAIGLVTMLDSGEEWIRSVDIEKLLTDPKVERVAMRTSSLAFSCDCSPAKLSEFFRTLTPETLNELYGSDEELTISCPRCGKTFIINRSDLFDSSP